MNYYFDDFTEENYRELLKLAKKKYELITYRQCDIDGKNILWRHDIDFSVHRAVKLARIEAEEGIKSTYFIHLHNENYNVFEKEIAIRIQEITELGHKIGVHFEPSFYSITLEETVEFEKYLKLEQGILEKFFHAEIEAFSFHNPDIGNWIEMKENEVGGMINTYAPFIREKFGYCSDSNGYWRFRRLKDVLESAEENNLQVLTHPEWWVLEVMAPRDRIKRCIEGRARNQENTYDKLLLKMNRQNVSNEQKL